MKTKVISLIGGPGSGKSVASAEIFAALKKSGRSTELTGEYAKDRVYEQAYATMDDQVYVFGKQYHRQARLIDKVEYIITDSPLILSLYYNKEESKYFDDFVIEQFYKFDNLVYFIERGDGYETRGRLQTLEESIEIDKRLKNLMNKYKIPYKSVPQQRAVTMILRDIEEKEREEI